MHETVHGHIRVHASVRLCLTAGLFSLPFLVRACPPAHMLALCTSLKARLGRSVCVRGGGGGPGEDGRRHTATRGRGMQSGHCVWVPGRWQENVPVMIEFFFPILEHFCPLFAHFAQMGSHFAQNTTPYPCP